MGRYFLHISWYSTEETICQTEVPTTAVKSVILEKVMERGWPDRTALHKTNDQRLRVVEQMVFLTAILLYF